MMRFLSAIACILFVGGMASACNYGVQAVQVQQVYAQPVVAVRSYAVAQPVYVQPVYGVRSFAVQRQAVYPSAVRLGVGGYGGVRVNVGGAAIQRVRVRRGLFGRVRRVERVRIVR